MNPETFYEKLHVLKATKNENFYENLLAIVNFNLVEKFEHGSDRPCTKDDFNKSIENRDKQISFAYLIFTDLIRSGFFSDENFCLELELLVALFILCGENSEIKPWNTENTVNTCKLLLSEVLNLYKCSDVTDLVRNLLT